MEFVQPAFNFEQDGAGPDDDETAVNLRAYFDRMPTDKLLSFDAKFNDAELASWDGNFKDDGTLMLPCSERDVDAAEFRRVAEEAVRHRSLR